MPKVLDALDATQRALPVALIATPRFEFQTCRLDDRAGEIAASFPDFDHLPVVEGPEPEARIIGLFDAYRFRNISEDRTVSDCASALAEGHLIGSDAAIIDFIKGAHAHSCRLLVSDTGITGLVTLSDLQELPVRAALFSMVTHLEMAMAEAIRREFPVGDQWKARLPADRQQHLEKTLAKARAGDALVDPLLFTQFMDKADIIRTAAGFGNLEFRSDMKRARDLRNSLAHSNRYADSREEAVLLCDTVRMIEGWIDGLAATDG